MLIVLVVSTIILLQDGKRGAVPPGWQLHGVMLLRQVNQGTLYLLCQRLCESFLPRPYLVHTCKLDKTSSFGVLQSRKIKHEMVLAQSSPSVLVKSQSARRSKLLTCHMPSSLGKVLVEFSKRVCLLRLLRQGLPG
jgi:hypothetical protein